jgi:Tfp pilus assembly protein PilV
MQTHCSTFPTSPPKKGRSRFRGKGGFTLVEVGVAGTVLVMGLCSALFSLQHGFQALDTARNSTLAAQIMQSEIERLRLLGWTEITNPAIIPANGTIDLNQVYSNNSVIAGHFTATRIVTPSVGREDTMLDISITVTWKSYNGVTHNRSFKTRYSKNGLYDYYYTQPGHS